MLRRPPRATLTATLCPYTALFQSYIGVLKLGSLKTEGDVVALATALERGAASAYIGQIAALREPKLAQLFASISADEATHWTTLNNAAGTPLPKIGRASCRERVGQDG